MRDEIVIRGAREHNLANIDVTIPRDRLVVVTGVSGSGKSSLAFDTLFAEGQRRYVESLSAYARQFLDQMEKPDVDTIEGLSPAISIEQKTTSRNPRSTVGTVTEIHDYLRLLWASIGVPLCPGLRPSRSGPRQWSRWSTRLSWPRRGTRFLLLAPLVEDRKGEHRMLFDQMVREGFVRARVDGELVDAASPPDLDKNRKHTIEVVVDRLSVRDGVASRLADSLETAFGSERDWSGWRWSMATSSCCRRVMRARAAASPSARFHRGCSPSTRRRVPAPRARASAFCARSTRRSWCSIPSDRWRRGAWPPVGQGPGSWVGRQLEQLAEHLGFDLHTPWRQPAGGRAATDHVRLGRGARLRLGGTQGRLPVPRPVRRVWCRDSNGATRRPPPRRCGGSSSDTCPSRPATPATVRGCDPRPWRSRSAGATWPRSRPLSVRRALEWFDALELDERDARDRGQDPPRGSRPPRLPGLGGARLSHPRPHGRERCPGGESQRIRLATQVGSKLMGVLYVLDEPSIGLHQRDNRRLLDTLKGMRDLGNTVVVVEHDEETIRDADWVIDLGPGAGRHGGQVVAAGPPDAIAANPKPH